VVRVRNKQLQADGLKVVGRERFDRRLCRDGHERGRFDITMRGVDDASAGASMGILCGNIKGK
jgi:hypothetical protein